jgi:hypothetical protein
MNDRQDWRVNQGGDDGRGGLRIPKLLHLWRRDHRVCPIE